MAITTETNPRTTGADEDCARSVADDIAVNDEVEGTDANNDGLEAPVEDDSNRRVWVRRVTYGVLPAIALLLALVSGFLKWAGPPVWDEQQVRDESVRIARDGTVSLLSYQPETVEKDLEAAQSRMTGGFLDAYASLTRDVVIPGAKEKHIAAAATVPAAASVSVTAGRAVVLLYVNQTVTIGQDPPTNTSSSVRVTLDKIGDEWLISEFDPV